MTMTARGLQGWNRHKTRVGVAVADEADGVLYATGSSFLRYFSHHVGPGLDCLADSVTYQLSRLI